MISSYCLTAPLTNHCSYFLVIFSCWSFGTIVLNVGYISIFYWLLAIISSEVYSLSCSKLYRHWIFLFNDNFLKIEKYFCVIFVKKEFGFFKSSGERVKFFNDCGSYPSSLVIHHDDDSVPNFFIVVFKFSKSIKNSKNCWDSVALDSVHIVSENLFEILFPKLMFFL